MVIVMKCWLGGRRPLPWTSFYGANTNINNYVMPSVATFTGATTMAAITAKPVTATATGIGKTYDGTATDTVSYALSGVQADSVTVTQTVRWDLVKVVQRIPVKIDIDSGLDPQHPRPRLRGQRMPGGHDPLPALSHARAVAQRASGGAPRTAALSRGEKLWNV